jgi:hypothetical protein
MEIALPDNTELSSAECNPMRVTKLWPEIDLAQVPGLSASVY